MYNQVEDTIGYKNVSEPPSLCGQPVPAMHEKKVLSFRPVSTSRAAVG